MAELATALRPPGNSGGAFEGKSYLRDESVNWKENMLRRLLTNDKSDNDDGEFLFDKLKKSPHLRKTLSALNRARAFNTAPGPSGTKNGTRKIST